MPHGNHLCTIWSSLPDYKHHKVKGHALLRFKSPEPSTASGTEQASVGNCGILKISVGSHSISQQSGAGTSYVQGTDPEAQLVNMADTGTVRESQRLLGTLTTGADSRRVSPVWGQGRWGGETGRGRLSRGKTFKSSRN